MQKQRLVRGLKLTTEWRAEWSGKPAIIETDCLTIVKALEAAPGTRAQWDGVLKDIQAECALLPSFKIRAVGRKANKVAHQLAQQAMRKKEFVVMLLNCPASVAVKTDAQDQAQDRSL
jgi:hypothetical protein